MSNAHQTFNPDDPASENVIHVNFEPEWRNFLRKMLKNEGYERTLKTMLANEEHPSYAKAILRNIMKVHGW
jgi:hypothetical protein